MAAEDSAAQLAAHDEPSAGAGCPDEVSRADFIWLAGTVCSLLRIPFDAALLEQRFAPPHSRAQLSDALRETGVDVLPIAPGHLADAGPLAAGDATVLAWLRGERGDDRPPRAALVLRAEPTQVVAIQAPSAEPEAIAHERLRKRLAAPLGLLVRRPAEPADADCAQNPHRFGFRWFLPELLRHAPVWRDVLLASAAIQLLALGTPLLTQAIIDKVVVHRTSSTLAALAVGLALFMVFTSAFTWLRQRLILQAGVRIDAVLASAVFGHLVRLPARYFQARPTGVIAARLHGIETIRDFLASAAISLVLDLPFLSVCLALMFSYSSLLATIAAAMLALIVAASLLVAPVFQARLDREFRCGARNQGFLTEFIAGMDTVKSLQMEPILERRFADYQAAYLLAGFATRQVANTYNVTAATLEQGLVLLILVVGAWIVMTPAPGAVFTVGMLVAFQMFSARLSQPLLRLAGLWQQFQQARLAVLRLGDVMNAPTEPYSLLPARSAAGRMDRRPLIEVRGLAFRHGEDRPLLFEDLSFSVGRGECVAIMGPSGCGKSTLARLLQGFYQPTRGSIVLGGVDTRYLPANELRAVFGVVPQETVLFSGTLLENLLLANAHAGFEDVVAACRLAEIHAVIEQLPQGYHTPIGERGAGLSGGQRQRVAIARALLKQPRVLIFDEATSHLDGATAASFARTIDRLRARVAILFITHAPPGTLQFDRVLRLGRPA